MPLHFEVNQKPALRMKADRQQLWKEAFVTQNTDARDLTTARSYLWRVLVKEGQRSTPWS